MTLAQKIGNAVNEFIQNDDNKDNTTVIYLAYTRVFDEDAVPGNEPNTSLVVFGRRDDLIRLVSLAKHDEQIGQVIKTVILANTFS